MSKIREMSIELETLKHEYKQLKTDFQRFIKQGFEVANLSPQDGDVVVIHIPFHLSNEGFLRVENSVKRIFPADTKFALLEEGMKAERVKLHLFIEKLSADISLTKEVE